MASRDVHGGWRNGGRRAAVIAVALSALVLASWTRGAAVGAGRTGAGVPPGPVEAIRTTADLDVRVGAGWQAAGVKTAPAVTGAAWLRRVWLDVAGAPPPPAEVAAFRDDEASRARVVDSLLAGPAYPR